MKPMAGRMKEDMGDAPVLFCLLQCRRIGRFGP